MADVTKTVLIDVQTDGAKDAAEDFSDIGDSIGFAGVSLGGLKRSLASANSGILTTVKSLKIFKVALISTGIGALVVAIGTLVTFFTKSQRGADKLSVAMEALGAIVGVLTDRAIQVGEAMFKIFSGDILDGLNQLGNAHKGIVDELINETEAAIGLEKARQANERQEIRLIRLNAERKAQIAELRKIGKDESLSALERLDANTKAQAIQNAMTADKIALQKEDVRILREKQALGENLISDDRELAEAEAALFAIQEAGSNVLKALLSDEIRLNAEREKEIALIQEIALIREDLALIREGQITEVTSKELKSTELVIKADKKLLDARIKGLFKITQERIKQTKKTNAEIKKDIIARDEFEAQLARDKLARELSVMGFILGGLKSFAKEGSALAKALGIFEATINTFRAITQALPNFPLAIATGVFGFAQVAKIASEKEPQFAAGGSFTIGGRRHHSGGTRFVGSDGSRFEAERGEKLFILNRGASGALKTLSKFNANFGSNRGGSFLQGGGIVSPAELGAESTLAIQEDLVEAISAIEPPKVSVVDIERVSGERDVSVSRSEF